jgi:hypothetical protein
MIRNISPRDWPAQNPPTDFASRTVAAALCDRADNRRGARPRRRLGVLAIATILVAGGAWASVALPKAFRPPASAPSVFPDTGQVKVVPTLPVTSMAREPAAEPPHKTPAAPTAAPRRYRESPAPASRRRVRIPTCNCVQAICDCGEEP